MAYASIGEDTGIATRGTVLTADSTANTKGAWVEISSSTPIDANGFWLNLFGIFAGKFLIDIATGAESSEVVLIENIMFHGSGSSVSGGVARSAYIPLAIPSGTRVAGRCQAATGSSTVDIVLTLADETSQSARPCARVTTYGADTSDSGGVAVDPGTPANTKVRTQIVASTTNDIELLLVAMTSQVTTANTIRFIFDVETGAAASEVVLIPNNPANQGTATDTSAPAFYGPFPVNISAGTRISINMQASETSAGRIQDFVLYGFDQQEAAPSGGGGSRGFGLTGGMS